MTHVEIEYCVPCGFLDQALATQRSLLEEFGRQLEGVQLTPGHGGVFEVHAGGDVVWDRDVHGAEVDVELVTDAVAERVEASG